MAKARGKDEQRARSEAQTGLKMGQVPRSQRWEKPCNTWRKAPQSISSKISLSSV